ncbi:MAG: hypothetical protein QNL33_11695 [Akkermansiaceae bacterium]|jgi:hypothetical protein
MQEPPNTRQFQCEHCSAAIEIPFNLPPTAEEKSKYVINGELKNDDREGIPPIEKVPADYFSEIEINRSDRNRGIYLMEYYRPRQFKMSEFFTPITKFEVRLNVEEPDSFARAQALQENHEMEAIRARAYFKRENDALLFDWSTFVQTKERMLRSFVRFPIAGKKQLFRVGVSEDATSLFEADASMRAYRISDIAHLSDDVVVVKVAKNSEPGRILESLAWTDQPGTVPFGRSATIELEWSSGAELKLSISRVICWEFPGVGGNPSNLKEGQ